MRYRCAICVALAICAVPPVELRADDAIKITAAARAIQPGELVVLSITLPAGVERLRVRAFDRDAAAFNVAPRSWRALVGIDLDVAPGVHHVSVEGQAGGQRIQTTYALRVRPHAFPTRRRARAA